MKWKETRSLNVRSDEFTDVPLAAVDAPPQPQVDGTAPTFSKKPTIIQVTHLGSRKKKKHGCCDAFKDIINVIIENILTQV